MLPGWTEEALIEEVTVAPRRAFLPLPDTQVIERPGWLQLITPSLRQGGLNEVVHAVLSEAEADAVIDETLQDYARRGLRLRWTVGPGSAPADLAERLERRGLRRIEIRGLACLTAPLPAAARPAPDAGAVTVEEVDERSLGDFTAVMAAGWGMDPATLDPLNRVVLRDPARRSRLLLARCDGAPAAVASMVLLPRSAYFIGGVTLPAFRGRGLYRALCAERLRLAAAQGRALATTHAMADSSAPILARLGFVEVCRFPSLVSAPR